VNDVNYFQNYITFSGLNGCNFVVLDNIHVMPYFKGAQDKTREELLKGVMELRNEHDALVASYEKDISDHNRAEQKLTVSEIRYRRLFESAKDGILILDSETGRIMDVNPFLIELLGYSKEQFVEKAIWEIGFFRDIIANYDKFLELRQTGFVRYDDLPLETAEGQKINVEFVSNVYTEGDHSVIQCNIRDITKRVKIEKEIHRVNSFMESIVENIPDMIFLKDANTLNFVMFNKAGEEMLGIPRQEILGKSDHDFFSKELADAFIEKDRQVLLNKMMFDIPEEPIQTRDKGKRILHTKKVPILNAQGEPVYLLGISEDITERKQAEADLIRAKEHAEESDRLKSAFLANMSHEIRTPMNGILGFAGLLKEPGLTGEEQKKFIGIIEKSGRRMLNIINDIVCISKLECGQMEISLAETNVNLQMEYIYSFLKPEVEIKGMQILYSKSLPEKDAIIITDCEKIYAILTNLVKNAIKFSHAGIIEIGFKKKNQFLEFFVKDSGEGIRLDMKEIIFERFRQGSELINRNYEGAGLGLSISKAYVEMLGGKIWVESEFGKGSTFFFTIPYHTGPDEKNIFKKVTKVEGKGNQIRNLKILIAEDDESSEMLITMAVNIFSKEILKARTGTQTVEICRNNPDIDLVLMDIKMPEMDGYTATRQIRQFNKEVIIIAQTAFALTGDRELAISAGCDDYITKPFNKEALTVLLKSVLINKKMKPHADIKNITNNTVQLV